MSFDLKNVFDVSGLVCVISGGGTGIGLMLAQALSQNGAKVYIIGRRKEKLDQAIEAHGKNISGSLHALQGDVTDNSSIKEMVKHIESQEGYIDVLINNAGKGGPGFAPKDSSDAQSIGDAIFGADYSEAIDLLKLNILSYYYMSGAFIPLLGKSPNSPQIVSIGSNAAFGREAMAGILYSCTKAALTHMTKMLATHLIDTKIRANVLAPGLFPSELVTQESDSRGKSHLKDLIGVPIPKSMNRAGEEQEMAAAILYLVNKRQTYANGTVVLIDGGVLCQMPSTY